MLCADDFGEKKREGRDTGGIGLSFSRRMGKT